MNWLKDLFKKESEQWYTAQIPAERTPGAQSSKEVVKDEEYLNIFLKSMRIQYVRKGFEKFYATVHSFVEVVHASGSPAKFNFITTPGNLELLDSSKLNRVVNINRRLFGPVPYRGGDVKFELGLFSVMEQNLSKPFIELLTTMSNLGGVSLISPALTFIEPLEKGISLLMGNENEVSLEIGLITDFSTPKTGYFVVIGGTKDENRNKKFSIDPNDFGLLNEDGSAYKDSPYLVFELSSSKENPDWFSIPEIKAAYRTFKQLVLESKIQDANLALKSLKTLLYFNGDLIRQQARNIYLQIQADMGDFLEGIQDNKDILESTQADLPELESYNEDLLALYKGYNGYQKDFLLGFPVSLPILKDFQQDLALRLDNNKHELKYQNYSVAVSKSRKFPIYAASNISGEKFRSLPRKDKWRKDPRLADEDQFGPELYGAVKSNFDRGHMTKREDVQWGDNDQQAAKAADSTFIYTNAVPQHARLNQRIWSALENYILHSESVGNKKLISVFTGPVLAKNDPVFVTRVEGQEVRLPLLFWKIVFYVKDEKLHRTGFLMSHYSLLLKGGIITTEQLENVTEDANNPFMDFEQAGTYQVDIKTIEALSGLAFTEAIEPFKDNRPVELIINEIDVPELAEDSTIISPEIIL